MDNRSFNPQARWDRQIPGDVDAASPEALNAIIECLAWFRNGKIYPRLFIWNNNKYKIKKITYNWQEHSGQATISYFSVSTGTEIYQLSFNNRTFGWRLDKVIE